MKILIFHNILWSHYKAAVFSELNQIAESRGDQLAVVHLAKNEKARAHMSLPDLSMHDYPYDVLGKDFIEDWGTFELFREMKKAISKFSPDLVVLPGYTLGAYQLLSLSLAFGRRMTVFNTVDSTAYDQKRSYLKELYKSGLMRLYDGVFCYGTLHREYIQQLGVPKNKIHIRLQATNSSAFLKSRIQPPHRLLYVGRLSKEKNLPVLVKQFLAIDSDWEFWLVGEGPEGKSLKQQYETEQRIKFLGNKKLEDLAAIYQSCSALILGSTSETWGLVVNEAMHSGLPVLVSEHCGCSKDLVAPDHNGYTFDPLRLDDIKEKLIKLFANSPSQLSAMGEKSLDMISKFTPHSAALQMMEAFELHR